MKESIHAHSNGIDYTLCGFALEGSCIRGDEDDTPIMAGSGKLVTCESCRGIIDYCKTFKGYKQP